MKLLACDTETVHGKPWCVQFSTTTHTGYMVMATDEVGISYLQAFLSRKDIVVVFHNAMFDLQVLDKLGVRPYQWTDTMTMAYLLQSESKALKVLAYRHCGMDMMEYREVVRPAGDKAAFDYLSSVVGMEWDNPVPFEYYNADGELKVKKGQNVAKKVMRALGDYAKSGGELDLRERWEGMDGREQVELVLGKMPEGTLADIPFEEAVEYSCKDPDATLRVYHALYPLVVERGLVRSLDRDMGCQPMVLDMMRYGIKIDVGHFALLSGVYEKGMREIQQEVNAVAGRNVNLNSPLQVGELLFSMGVIGKRNKRVEATGEWEEGYESTASDVLDKLKPQFPIVMSIQRYRSLSKFKSTYVDALPVYAGRDGRVRADFSMTRTDTGRLACSKPNLMNQPVRSEEGKAIRKGFVAEDGCVLVSIDLSQIEMRLTAHMSGDVAMVDTFTRNGDVHTETAVQMFRLPPEKIDAKKHRYPAKRTGFGVVYGISNEGLYDVFVHEDIYDFTPADCQGFIDRWFGVHKGVADWIDETRAWARRNGWVEDMFGRKRWVPEAQSAIEKVREAGYRKAINAPIQMGAQGILKEIMCVLTPIYQDFNSRWTCRPLIQIHDELLFEVREDRVGDVVDVMVPVFENAVKLVVPVLCDVEVGRNWMEQVGYSTWREGVCGGV